MRVLITGVTGQDGSYLAEQLLSDGCSVYGIERRSSVARRPQPGVQMVPGDVTDYRSIAAAVREIRPHQVYNLAAQSFVGTSFDLPQYTFDVNATGAVNVFEAVLREWPYATVYQASSSEQFGGGEGLTETSPFCPRSPYAAAKVAAHYAAQEYRRRGLFVSCGILFNHESERRGPEFVTRKIVRYAVRLLAGDVTEPLHLGPVTPRRDWGYAPDYVRGMRMIMSQKDPMDCVLATGQVRSVLSLIELVERVVGVRVPYVSGPPRPSEVWVLRGDASVARSIGWAPSITFEQMIRKMVDSEIRDYVP